ncbi:MAG: hypothetical protein RR415_09290 [Ruthenibacterium sp.]
MKSQSRIFKITAVLIVACLLFGCGAMKIPQSVNMTTESESRSAVAVSVSSESSSAVEASVSSENSDVKKDEILSQQESVDLWITLEGKWLSVHSDEVYTIIFSDYSTSGLMCFLTGLNESSCGYAGAVKKIEKLGSTSYRLYAEVTSSDTPVEDNPPEGWRTVKMEYLEIDTGPAGDGLLDATLYTADTRYAEGGDVFDSTLQPTEGFSDTYQYLESAVPYSVNFMS